MASKGHVIKIASDAGAYEKGIKSDVIQPTENAREALEKLADTRSGDKLASQMQKAQRETKELARETKRAADAIDDGFRDGYRRAKQATDDGLTGMKHATEEASDELKQNLGETFSSFRGDLEDLPQVAQDVFGGLAGSVGGLGASLALAGGAAGIGLLIQGFQNLQKEEEDRKQRITEWAQAYIGGLSTMKDALADFATVEAIYTDKDRYAEAERNAKNWHVTTSEAVNAMAGDMTALGAVQQNLADNSALVGEALDAAGGNVRGLNHDMRELRDQTNQGQEAYNKLTGEMEAGRARADEYSQSLLNLVQSSNDAAVEVDELGNKVVTLPDGKQILIDANTGQASANLDKFKGDADGVIDHVNGREVVLQARAQAWQAQNDIDRFISDNDGRSFTVYGRVRVDQTGTWGP